MGQEFDANGRRRIFFLGWGQKKSNIFRTVNKRKRKKLVQRQRYIKYSIYSFNIYLLSVHHELETGEYILENKKLSFQRKWKNATLTFIPPLLCCAAVIQLAVHSS